MYRSRIVKRGLITIGIVLGILAVLLYRGDLKRYPECQKKSEWFNAKPVTYQGKTYQVKVCGDGAGITGDLEKIKVSVYAPDGDLVAVRRFTADFLGFIAPLEYKPEGIEYWDDDYGPAFIRMPPTREDWVKARIPLISGISESEVKRIREERIREEETARAIIRRSAGTVFDPDEPVITGSKSKAEARLRNREADPSKK